MSVKILHCADMHLGGSAAGGEIKRRLMRGFLKIIGMCAEQGTDLLLIAGDMFDTKNPPPDVVNDVRTAFSKIRDTRVFISPGNHDPYSSDSVYMRVDFGENVHIFGGKAECVTIERLRTRVYGAGFTDEIQEKSLMKNMRAERGGYVNICVMHGDYGVQKSVYNPIPEALTAESGFDYIALGHIHKHGGFCRAGGSVVAYSGINEGRGFDETGDKGVIVGELDKTGARLSFRKTCEREYHILETDVSGAYSDESAAEIIRSDIEKRCENPLDNFYRITMRGIAEGAFRPNPAAVSAILADLGITAREVSDRTRPDYDIESVSRDKDIRGEFARVMLGRIASAAPAEKEKYRSALLLGLRAFDGGVDYIADYSDTY